jgi:hypothetical protein
MFRTLVGLAAVGLSVTALSQAPPAPPAAAAATPKTTDGHPDLNGFWGNGPIGFPLGPVGAKASSTISAPLRNGDISNLTNDNVIARRVSDNMPIYKPEYWAKVEELDHNGNKMDPFVHCMPPAVPRLGPPAQIIQMPNQILFFYRVAFQRNDFKIIPIGPRTHPLDPDGTWTGDSIAKWDGDTLVVETEGFNDQSWIDSQGYLHGYNMKTTERFHRDGNSLIYSVTVEDPDYLARPWVIEPQKLGKIDMPNYYLDDAPPCSDRDADHQVGTQREL